MSHGSERKATRLVALLVLLAVHTAFAAECPSSARFNGCRTKGCRELLVGAGEEPVLICDECGHGFKLVAAGTPYATCGMSRPYVQHPESQESCQGVQLFGLPCTT